MLSTFDFVRRDRAHPVRVIFRREISPQLAIVTASTSCVPGNSAIPGWCFVSLYSSVLYSVGGLWLGRRERKRYHVSEGH